MRKPNDGTQYWYILMGEEKIKLCERPFWQTDILCIDDFKSNNCFTDKRIAKKKFAAIKKY